MRVVIDACIDPRLVEAFPDHQVQTLFDLGWQHLKDHVLLKQLECDVFVTADRGFEHEQDLKSVSFGIVIHVASNKNHFLSTTFPQLRQAVATIRAGNVVHVYGLPVARPPQRDSFLIHGDSLSAIRRIQSCPSEGS
jgi:hypothetical protein